MKSECVIFMTGSGQNPKSRALIANSVASCMANCRAPLVFVDNTSPDPACQQTLAEELAMLHATYIYDPAPYNGSRLSNLAAEITKGSGSEFIAYCNADLRFHAGWLDRLLEAWRREPGYFAVSPYSFSDRHKGLNYRGDPNPAPSGARLIPCDHPAPWCIVRRRNDGFTADERFPDWNCEWDFYFWMRAHGKLGGVCYSSRVDHLGGGMRTTLDNFGLPAKGDPEQSTALLRQKWPQFVK